jgi:FtsP/CotA-like multicopper oxidase with cupredoxin domain
VPLSLHWQGVRGPNATDGVGGLTQAPVPPGGTFDYRFTPPDPGTFLVRALAIGSAAEPAGRGLAGLLVVEERDAPAVDADHVLLVQDWLLAPTGELAQFGGALEAGLAGRLGNRVTVSGRSVPERITAAPGSRLRLRLANACTARIMRVRFDNLKVYVAAIDSQPTDTFEPLRSTLPFPPGTRYDLFVDVPESGGQTGSVVALIGAGLSLAEIVIDPSAKPRAERPPLLPLKPTATLPPEIKLQNALRKDVVIAGGAVRQPNGEFAVAGDPKAIWTINGKAGSAGAPPLLSARRGQPVVLAVHNRTAFPQPLHLHGHVVRLLHPMDDGWEPYWLDTLQVPEGRTTRVAFLPDNPGRWCLGSTVLDRFDTGLWTWLEVS